MLICDILTKDVKVIGPDAFATDVAIAMAEKNCGSIPVAENNRLIGMITDRDLAIRCVATGLDPAATKARDIMSAGIVYYCYSDEPVEDVVRKMGEVKVRRLPVMNRENDMVGIVSLGDLAIACEDSAICGEALERIRLCGS